MAKIKRFNPSTSQWEAIDAANADTLGGQPPSYYATASQVSTNTSNIGNLSNLQTSTKSDLVSAINEVKNISNNGLKTTNISTNTTLTPSQSGIIMVTTGSSAITVTLPTAVGNAQLMYVIKKADNGSGTVTIATTASQTIDGTSTKTLTNQYADISVVSDGSNWIVYVHNDYDKIGLLSNLPTQDKSSLVNSITEISNTKTSNLNKANDVLITSTSAQQIVSYIPTSKNNFMVMIYYRVVTGTTNVTVQVTYNDGTGAQTNTMLNAQSSAVGSYSLIPLFINATNSAAITVSITASVANQVYASASIVGV
jgi:hypothetical protein